jgi:ABC-type nickel/cobalt efflux system permease component RcnA
LKPAIPLLVLGAVCVVAEAHEPSKVDHNTVIRILPGNRISIDFQVWWGKFRALYLRCEEIDVNRDKRLSPDEKEAFRKRKEAELVKGLTLKVDGRPRPFHILASALSCESDQCIAEEASVSITLVCDVPGGRMPSRIEFFDDNEVPPVLAGNNAIRLELPEGFRIRSEEPRTEWNSQLVTGGTYWVGEGPAAPPREKKDDASPVSGEPETGKDPLEKILDDLIKGEGGTIAIVIALVLAFWLGAGHALAPGHGKAMVAGYLVGSKGRVRDAVFLGLVVTLTHISSVVILGLLMLYLSSIFRQEHVFPWMTLVSGALILLIGISIFFRSSKRRGEDAHSHGWGIFKHTHGPASAHHHGHDHPHDHDHGHDHGHLHDHSHEHGHNHDHEHPQEDPPSDPSGSVPMARPAQSPVPPDTPLPVALPVTMDSPRETEKGTRPGVRLRDLLVLGVSGGLVPCPSALAVLLLAIAFGVPHIGLILICAFSLGLAMVLVGIGVVLVLAGNVASRFGVGGGRWTWILPKISGTAVTLVGLMITLKGLAMLGVVTLPRGF